MIQPALGGGPTVEVGRCFDLGHDVLGHVAGDSGRARRHVAGEEHCRGRQAVVPAVLADRLEEHSRRGEGVLLRVAAEGLGDKPGQVAFEQGTVDTGEGVDLGGGLGQERGKSPQAPDVGLHGGGAAARAQPQPGPAFGQHP